MIKAGYEQPVGGGVTVEFRDIFQNSMRVCIAAENDDKFEEMLDTLKEVGHGKGIMYAQTGMQRSPSARIVSVFHRGSINQQFAQVCQHVQEACGLTGLDTRSLSRGQPKLVVSSL